MHGDTGFLDPASPADDPGLAVELRSVVASARRRALRDGDPRIDTAHLLHSLLEADPPAREALGGDQDGARMARVLGYLVQRSIGYGMRWHGSVEDSGNLPSLGQGSAMTVGTAGTDVPGWSPSAVAAMRAAVDRAHRRGAGRADGRDLLAALAADRGCRAAEVLRAAGIDPERLAPG